MSHSTLQFLVDGDLELTLSFDPARRTFLADLRRLGSANPRAAFAFARARHSSTEVPVRISVRETGSYSTAYAALWVGDAMFEIPTAEMAERIRAAFPDLFPAPTGQPCPLPSSLPVEASSLSAGGH